MPLGRLSTSVLCCFVCLTTASLARGDAAHLAAGESELARPDSHAPLGVMGDHMHAAGEWMVSYRYMRMRMDGNRDGTRDLGRGEVLAQGFAATPTDMDMEMHMLGVMFAPTDWITGMLMVPYAKNAMDHVTGMGGRFRTESEGIGDVKLSALIRLFADEMHHLHANLGLSFPSGSVREQDAALTPMGPAEITLPFPMQTGSGTWDVLPGLTYNGRTESLSWGAQVMGTIRPGRNRRDWAAGHRAEVTAWAALPVTENVSVSIRPAFRWWGNHRGDERRPPLPTQIPTADPDRRAGRTLDLYGGINVILPLGSLGENRFAVEFGGPLYEHLDGPQLETDWQLVVGWQKAF